MFIFLSCLAVCWPSIFFTYLWSCRWPNYIVTLPRYFSFRLPHLNIPTGAPSDELDKSIRRNLRLKISHIILQSMSTTINVVNSNPAQTRCTRSNIMWQTLSVTCCEFESRPCRCVLDTTLCDKVCRWFSPGMMLSGTFNNIFSFYVMAVSFINGKNHSTWWKPPTCSKSLTKFVT
jgi:hypothetical protein